MTNLATALLGKTRSALLAVLLLRPDQPVHVRQLARLTGSSAGNLHRELKALESLGVLTRIQTGNQVSYGANEGCPIFGELASILRKTAGLADVLTDALHPLRNRLDLAFVFGSIAAAQQHSNSDVDLLLVGTASLGEIVMALAPAQDRLRREINPVMLSPDEFRSRRELQDRFLSDVLRKPKLWLFGGTDEPGQPA